MEQEKHFDNSIRRKLLEEDYTPPPFSPAWQKNSGSGFNWLRGFLFSDMILMMACVIWSALAFSSESKLSNNSFNSARGNEQSILANVVSEEFSTAKSESFTENQTAYLNNNKTRSTGNSHSYRAARFGSAKSKSQSATVKPADSDQELLALNTYSPLLDLEKESSPGEPILANEEVIVKEDIELLSPLPLSPELSKDYTIKTREFGMSPPVYRSPFSLEIMMIGERTIGYNSEIPAVSQLYLDLTPRDGAYGIGFLINYRIKHRVGIKTGFETVLRKYNLNYTYSHKVSVEQPDGSYKDETQILRNSRSVSETEMRFPLLFTYSFVCKKWVFEPSAGFTIKLKNLYADASGANNQIPAEILSTIKVSNEHLITAGWMLGCQAAYAAGENCLIFAAPYYQAESFDKDSRQYYSGRAISGVGVKAGIRLMFNKDE